MKQTEFASYDSIGFYSRWGINLSDDEKWKQFKNRMLNAYSATIGKKILNNIKCEQEFFTLMGIHDCRLFDETQINGFLNMYESDTYKYLVEQINYTELVKSLEVLFCMETVDWEDRYAFIDKIKESIELTGVAIIVYETKADTFIVQSGAALLDTALVKDVLDWLLKYPSVYELYKKSLVEFGVKGKERFVVDNLRLSLELLLKQILKNEKSLENQQAELGKYMNAKNSSNELVQIYCNLLNQYSKYQNENAKHNDIQKANEVEFILYLTGLLMRHLISK